MTDIKLLELVFPKPSSVLKVRPKTWIRRPWVYLKEDVGKNVIILINVKFVSNFFP